MSSPAAGCRSLGGALAHPPSPLAPGVGLVAGCGPGALSTVCSVSTTTGMIASSSTMIREFFIISRLNITRGIRVGICGREHVPQNMLKNFSNPVID